MHLHDFWRSSAAYRVRIALNLKGLSAGRSYYPLREGAHRSPEYLARNPQGLVPALETDDGSMLFQSMAICEWLEECRPEPPLLPKGSEARARVRAIAQSIACDLHPVNNLRIQVHLREAFGIDEAGLLAWYRHWIAVELGALETRLAAEAATGRFCHGDTPSLADCFLIPQMYNARRFDCDTSGYPTLRRIDEACLALGAFAAAVPEAQPDAP